MVPAVGWQGALIRYQVAEDDLITTMEPAVERREHSVPTLAPRMLLSPPQWSRRKKREHDLRWSRTPSPPSCATEHAFRTAGACSSRSRAWSTTRSRNGARD
jgi:hypothetical protein